MAVALACAGIAAESVKAQRLFSFPTRHKVLQTCRSLHCSNCDTCTRHCQGFENWINLGWKGVDFLNRHCFPLVACVPHNRIRTSTVVSHGGCDHVVVAAASIPLGIRSFHLCCCHLVVPRTCCFLHGKRSRMRNMARNKSCQSWRCAEGTL